MSEDVMPSVVKIETRAKVGPEKDPAVVIWFDNQSALRYRWSDDHGEIREETYADGVVHDSFGVGGSLGDLSEYALETISEYLRSYRRDPEALEKDWPHVYDMLVEDF